ncbi:hypothetical protein AGDE_02657 [Angomonas deanei]|uniref:Uncharacterized protein n=1 Tax=Angomonas deanei TaxID=59799 RepID=S9WRC7_9TRYP|nr:hypothetical protein AGDE_05424 [Angomonas deanei]EPY41268.1 hypothetical protein AGDE_02657 [Angomonas deanei]CAD2213037.1 hypothetical protein, conserved [Angomonas deanei]|eukprot:EPY38505.1 hypothetical protein AGDE_05424 [Angomonas deanei]
MADQEKQIQQLEQRATTAEKQIEQLTKQLSGGKPGGNMEPRLRELLKLMEEDRVECESIRSQRNELKEENERLRKQVGKQDYRIQHLLKTIAELEAKK